MNGDNRPDLVLADNTGLPANTTGNAVFVLLNSTAGSTNWDFTIAPAQGTETLQTITAGKSATFNLVIIPSGSFSGTVSLTCSVTPNSSFFVPQCNVPGSVSVSTKTTAPVTLIVSTATRSTAARVSNQTLLPGTASLCITFTGVLLGFSVAWTHRHRRYSILVAPILVFFVATFVACGGGSSSRATPQSSGTPAGSYTVTLKSTLGSLSHSTSVTVIVQ